MAYFVYSLLVPTVSGILASSQVGYRDVQPWVDLNAAEAVLFDGTITGDQWTHLAVTATFWIVLPALIGLVVVRKSEVK